MNDTVKKAETEVKTLWHEIEEFFARLTAHVAETFPADENKKQVLNTFKEATHETVGTTPPEAQVDEKAAGETTETVSLKTEGDVAANGDATNGESSEGVAVS